MDLKFIMNLWLYFIIYSFIGWLYESILKTITQKKIVNSGFLFGAFCPIYGAGAVIMLVFLDWLQGSNILLFITAFFILSIWEYLVGFFLEKMFNTKYWDYSNLKFNIKGRVSLQTSLVWGGFSVIFINFLHPLLERFIDIIPVNALNYISVIALIYLIVDTTVSVIKVNNINIRLEKLSEIGDIIKEKLEELKLETEKSLQLEKLQVVIDELKEKQLELKEKLEKQSKRLKRAFPDMKAQIKQRKAEIKERIEEIKNRVK